MRIEGVTKHFDHVTIVVRDLESAKRFFGLLGFEEDIDVEISGEQFAKYMGVEGIDAEHVTLVLKGVRPRTEVQLLKYIAPEVHDDAGVTNLHRPGYNHVCFAVEDIEATLERLIGAGVKPRNELMEFNDRKLVFLWGPEGVTVELAEWLGD